MSEAVEISEFEVGELPESLARLLGNEALGRTLQLSLDKMSPAARINAINSMAGLITSLETVAVYEGTVIDLRDTPVHEPHVHLLHEQSKATSDEPISPKLDAEHEVKVPETTEPHDLVDPANTAELTTGEQLAKKPLTYMYTYFDKTLVSKLHQGHIEPLAQSLGNAYKATLKMHKEGSGDIVAELAAYLRGVSDEEIAAAFGRSTASAAQIKRSQLFVKIRNSYTQAEIDALLSTVLTDTRTSVDANTEPRGQLKQSGAGLAEPEGVELTTEPMDQSTEAVLGEQHEGVVYDRAGSASSRIEEILAENGVVVDDTVKEEISLRDKVLFDVLELWGSKEALINSYEAMFSEQQPSPASASARQELKDLMEKYAPRWMQKLGIPQHPWQLTRNVLGSDRKPISLKEADRTYRGRLALAKTTAEDEFLQIIEFLVGKQLAGAPAEPKAHMAKPGHGSFRKGRKK